MTTCVREGEIPHPLMNQKRMEIGRGAGLISSERQSGIFIEKLQLFLR
jgi:hypothetical protein